MSEVRPAGSSGKKDGRKVGGLVGDWFVFPALKYVPCPCEVIPANSEGLQQTEHMCFPGGFLHTAEGSAHVDEHVPSLMMGLQDLVGPSDPLEGL